MLKLQLQDLKYYRRCFKSPEIYLNDMNGNFLKCSSCIAKISLKSLFRMKLFKAIEKIKI